MWGIDGGCGLGKLVLIGGGGHCKSVLDSALAMKTFEEIVITDAGLAAGKEVFGCRVAGTDKELYGLAKKGFGYAFITVGSIKSAKLRKQLSAVAMSFGFRFPVICDPTACVSPFAVIGEGTFIGKNVVVNAEARVGRHCIINIGSILEHECTIGDYSHISVGSILCGNCHVGRESFIGAGSTVIQEVSVGDHTVVGAGSRVLANVGDDMKVYGVIGKCKSVSKQGGGNLTFVCMLFFWGPYPGVA